ncbi:CRPV-036 [Crowpox virus]|nr:CRPV-036 [Crowpox virus]
MCLLMFLKIYDNNRKIRYVDKDKKLIHDLIIESGRKHIRYHLIPIYLLR